MLQHTIVNYGHPSKNSSKRVLRVRKEEKLGSLLLFHLSQLIVACYTFHGFGLVISFDREI